MRISWSIGATTYCYLKCIVYDKLLKPRQSFRITLYILSSTAAVFMGWLKRNRVFGLLRCAVGVLLAFRRFEDMYLLHLQGRKIYSRPIALKMKASPHSETQRSNSSPRRRNKPKHPTPHYGNRSATKPLSALHFPPASVAPDPQYRI